MKKQTLSFLLIILSLFFYHQVFAQDQAKNPQNMQVITGSLSFPNVQDPYQVYVRISVDPKDVSKEEKSLAKIMDKIVVVACTAGTCKFAQPLIGLGFYQTNFSLPQAVENGQEIQVITVACSYLGCDKRVLNTKVCGKGCK